MSKEQFIGQGSPNLLSGATIDSPKQTLESVNETSTSFVLPPNHLGGSRMPACRQGRDFPEVKSALMPPPSEESFGHLGRASPKAMPAARGVSRLSAKIVSETPFEELLPRLTKQLSTQKNEAFPMLPKGDGVKTAEVKGNHEDQVQLKSQEDARLVVQRDSEAFAQLYEENLGVVHRFIYFKLGSEELAEDLTADVFLKAWEGADRFQWRDIPFEHWLIRIARNTVIDHWRKYRHQMSSIDEHRDKVSDALAPEGWVAHDQEVEKLSAALMKLSDDQKDVIILRFIEGYSHKDTAVVLGKSEVYVRQIQVRALQKLRKILRSQERLEDVLRSPENMQVRK